MYNNLSKCIEKPSGILKFFKSIRYLSATEISTALRPFYFSVHPDLFGKYPSQRTINENSLQQLSSFIERVQSRKPLQPCTLQFYLRENKNNGKFRLVQIPLQERNIRNTIHTILKTCNLSTEYLDSVAPEPQRYEPIQQQMYPNEYDIFGLVKVKRKIEKVKEAETLRQWLEENYKSALEKYEANKPLRKDIESICKEICENLGVKEIKWDCGWNEMHFRGCLQSFRALANDHPTKLQVLRGRTIVFAPFTGVSLDGHIMLNSGEVRHNWLDLIKNIRSHDVALLRIPSFERAVSQVLRDIKVVRRKFMPKVVAGEYEKHLRQLMTNISDYHGFRGYPDSWPQSLKDHQIVVETEAGPLMVSPTGQFIVPSSCPGFLLVSFITENLKMAAQRTEEYNTHKHIERFLHALCLKELNLAGLRKDDNVTPELMIKSCELLLKHKADLSLLKNLHLNISTYYSLLSDGVVCIPWNFKI